VFYPYRRPALAFLQLHGFKRVGRRRRDDEHSDIVFFLGIEHVAREGAQPQVLEYEVGFFRRFAPRARLYCFSKFQMAAPTPKPFRSSPATSPPTAAARSPEISCAAAQTHARLEGTPQTCHVRSKDEVEPREVAPTPNEADLSQTSTHSLAHRRRHPRSIEPMVGGRRVAKYYSLFFDSPERGSPLT